MKVLFTFIVKHKELDKGSKVLYMNLTKDFLLWVLLFILVHLYFIDNGLYSHNFLIIDGSVLFSNFHVNKLNSHELAQQLNLY